MSYKNNLFLAGCLVFFGGQTMAQPPYPATYSSELDSTTLNTNVKFSSNRDPLQSRQLLGLKKIQGHVVFNMTGAFLGYGDVTGPLFMLLDLIKKNPTATYTAVIDDYALSTLRSMYTDENQKELGLNQLEQKLGVKLVPNELMGEIPRADYSFQTFSGGRKVNHWTELPYVDSETVSIISDTMHGSTLDEVRQGDSYFFFNPPGITDNRSGIIDNPDTKLFAGKTRLQRKQIAADLFKGHPIESVLRGTLFPEAKLGFLYGTHSSEIEFPERLRQTSDYLNDVKRASSPHQPIIVFSPEKLDLLKTVTKEPIHVLSMEDFKSLRHLENDTYLVSVGKVLNNQFTGLLASSDIPVIIEGNSSISNAIRLNIPFVMYRSRWNARQINDLIQIENTHCQSNHLGNTYPAIEKLDQFFSPKFAEFLDALQSSETHRPVPSRSEIFSRSLGIRIPTFSNKLNYIVEIYEKTKSLRNLTPALRDQNYWEISQEVKKKTGDVPLEYSILWSAFQRGEISENLLNAKKQELSHRGIDSSQLEQKFTGKPQHFGEILEGIDISDFERSLPTQISEDYLQSKHELQTKLNSHDPAIVEAFEAINHVFQQKNADPRPEKSGHRINYDYISHDPFLHRYQTDLDQRYPHPIQRSEMLQIQETLTKAIEELRDKKHSSSHNLSLDWSSVEATFDREPSHQDIEAAIEYNLSTNINNVAMGMHNLNFPRTQNILKRLKRLFDTRNHESNSDQLRALAIALMNNYVTTRCIDGVSDSLSRFEQDDFGASHQTPVHGGELISRLLAHYRGGFIEKHAGLLGNLGQEAQTDTIVNTRKLTTLPLSLIGEPPQLEYNVGASRDPEVSARIIAERLIHGGLVEPLKSYSWNAANQAQQPIHFEPYTLELLIKIAQKSRTDYLAHSQTVSPQFSDAELTEEINRFRDLKVAYDNLTGENRTQLSELESHINEIKEDIPKIVELVNQWATLDTERTNLNTLIQEKTNAGQSIAQLRMNLIRMNTQLAILMNRICDVFLVKGYPDEIEYFEHEKKHLEAKIAFGNPYFRFTTDHKGEKKLDLTRQFWIFLMKKYGYIDNQYPTANLEDSTDSEEAQFRTYPLFIPGLNSFMMPNR